MQPAAEQQRRRPLRRRGRAHQRPDRGRLTAYTPPCRRMHGFREVPLPRERVDGCDGPGSTQDLCIWRFQLHHVQYIATDIAPNLSTPVPRTAHLASLRARTAAGPSPLASSGSQIILPPCSWAARWSEVPRHCVPGLWRLLPGLHARSGHLQDVGRALWLPVRPQAGACDRAHALAATRGALVHAGPRRPR
jgi:hypothetical protein